MRYFGMERGNVRALAIAGAVAVGVREFVFTPDANLLIVGIVFVVAYSLVLGGITLWERRRRG